MRLTINTKYDLDTLSVIGWSAGSKWQTEAPAGYDAWAYFEDGVYLGPDKYGVEPLFADVPRPLYWSTALDRYVTIPE